MKIWKMNKVSNGFLRVLDVIPKQEGTNEFWDEIRHKVLRNQYFSEEEFAALYYATTLVREAVVRKQPDVLIVPMEEPEYKQRLDEFERKMSSQISPFEDALQHMYITLCLEKPNGREYCEGSLKYTDEQYKARHEEVMRDIIGLKEIAEVYVKNLDKLNPVY